MRSPLLDPQPKTDGSTVHGPVLACILGGLEISSPKRFLTSSGSGTPWRISSVMPASRP